MWSWPPLIRAEKAPSWGSGYMGLRETMCILIFPFFIVDTTSIFKQVFPTVY